MEKKLLTIKKRTNQEESVYEYISKQLHTNPIKNSFLKNKGHRTKTSIWDIFKNF